MHIGFGLLFYRINHIIVAMANITYTNTCN